MPGKMKNNGFSVGRFFRYIYLRFHRLKCSDVEVAQGVALGVFIGMTPTMGIQIPLVLLCAMILKESKVGALLGIFITNPLTAIPIYTINFKVGKYILGTPNLKMPIFTSLHEVLGLGYDFLLPLFFGSCLLGIIAAGIAYVITLKVYRYVKTG